MLKTLGFVSMHEWFITKQRTSILPVTFCTQKPAYAEERVREAQCDLKYMLSHRLLSPILGFPL